MTHILQCVDYKMGRQIFSLDKAFVSFYQLFFSYGEFGDMYANLVILATAVTYYQLSGGESWTLRWLRSLLDKMDIIYYFKVQDYTSNE